jgi:hypothetical protein
MVGWGGGVGGDFEVSGSATAKSYGSGSATLPVGSSWIPMPLTICLFYFCKWTKYGTVLGCKILN